MNNLVGWEARVKVARSALALLDGRFTSRVALYILPNGDVLRVSNPRLRDEDVTDALIGVYDATATEDDIVADIMATAAA